MQSMENAEWRALGKLAWGKARVSTQVRTYCTFEELDIAEQQLWIDLARSVTNEFLRRAVDHLTNTEH